jgi:hypothetical protein
LKQEVKSNELQKSSIPLPSFASSGGIFSSSNGSEIPRLSNSCAL